MATSTALAPTKTSLLHNHAPIRAQQAHPPRAAILGRRREYLLLLTAAAPALAWRERVAKAEDIPLFGLRKKLKKAEEEAEEIVKAGFETAEKGLETAAKGIVAAEKGIVAAEKGIETAEREIEEAVSFGGLAQAGAVAGAEIVGVLIATSVVNGILGPEAQ
ncbi:hypothetical protein RJ641_023805 [Dillenia turbinata]|uniref:Uncharacterized protein n=1 Tax=Dillenia turbinata TaxID=194707 RepID=A0AAN8UJZ6_9MAGN